MPTYARYSGVGGGGIQSINNSTVPAQQIVAGTGINVGTVVGTGITTITNTAPMAATGNLTELTSSVLTITGGTGCVIGSGTTIQVLQSGAAQDGYLSSADWNTFNSKQNALTFGNLSETGSSILTITGGTGAVIGSGTTIQVAQASATTSGFLSSTDWSTFNGKQPAGNYITALTGEVTASGPGSVAATIAGQSGNSGKFLVTNGTTVIFDSVVNEAAGNIDFRVEGQLDPNLLFTDASADRVGIGNNTPAEKLHVSGNIKVVSALLDGLVSGTLTQSAADTTSSYGVKWPSAQGSASTVLQNDGSGNLSWAVASLPAQNAGTAGKFLISDGTNASWDTVVNEGGSATIDFRVEGDTDDHLLFTDASTNRVGVGSTTPSFKLDVVGTIRATEASGVNRIIIDSGDTEGKLLSFRTGNSQRWAIRSGVASNTNDDLSIRRYDDSGNFVDSPILITRATGVVTINNASASTADLVVHGDTDTSLLVTDASADSVGIGTNAPGAKLDVRGSVIINEAGGDNDVRIEGDADANLLFTDASTDRVGIGNSAPTAKLDVTGNIIASTDIQSTSQNGGQLAGTRNRIINGAMQIDQRNAGASVTLTTTAKYPVDRFAGEEDTDGTMDAEQVEDAPAGFYQSIKFTTTTADASLGATQYVVAFHRIEGSNVNDLNWGTANAKQITLSFWVKSSLTGTFSGSLRNSAADRSYAFEYTINSSNTWEQKSVTISGDTTGTWLQTNGTGIQINWGLGVGSTYSGTAGAWAASNFLSATGAVSVIGTLNATWFLTGVQFEVGPVATSFEWRNYQQELAMCQRYYEKSFNIATAPGQNLGTVGPLITVQVSGAGSSQYLASHVKFSVAKRATPTTLTTYNPSAANAQIRDTSLGADWSATSTSGAGTNGFGILGTSAAGSGAGNTAMVHWSADAEL